MERYDLALLTKKLLDSSLDLVDKKTLADLWEIENQRTVYRIIRGFVNKGIIEKIERDKYRIGGRGGSFEIANFLYQPSYVSLETALNHWGVLSQFPFEISSVTVKKSVKKEYEDKVYAYYRLSNKYFGGFEKIGGFLIATAEKALFDLLYLVSKGVKNIDEGDYDLGKIDRSIFEKIAGKDAVGKRILKLYVQLLKKNDI